MVSGKTNKEVELKFQFDRLAPKKLSLAYGFLVPELGDKEVFTIVQIDDYEQISCDIHEGIFRPTEGSSND